jgi:PAS domain S-box-containing protein
VRPLDLDTTAAAADGTVIGLTALPQRLAEDAAALLAVDLAAIYLDVDGSGEASWACDSGCGNARAGRGVRQRRISAGVGMGGRALATGTTRVARGGGRQSEGDRLRLVAAVALASRERPPLGVLCLFQRSVREFSPREVWMAEALARHAAIAIDAVRRFERLREADALHRLLLDRLPDGVWAADEHGTFTYLSAGCEPLLGYRPDELIGKSSQLVMHESTREAFLEGYRWQVAHPDGDQTYRVNLRHKDGHPVPVELHNVGISKNGRYGGGQGSVREMTDRDRLEREIRAQAAELASGRERAHLAQELHDSVTQALFSMTITAGAARMLLERGAPGVDAKLDELAELARDALAEMRSLIFELRPGSLAEEGFAPALRKHVAAVQGRTGLVIRLDVDPGLPRLPLSIEDALYRIAQEAVHNVVKHARAREVAIRIGHGPAGVVMEISDDGVGFDQRAKTDGLGLAGMTARAERFDGTVTVTSSAGRGTLVAVTLPTAVVDDRDLRGSDTSASEP